MIRIVFSYPLRLIQDPPLPIVVVQLIFFLKNRMFFPILRGLAGNENEFFWQNIKCNTIWRIIVLHKG